MVSCPWWSAWLEAWRQWWFWFAPGESLALMSVSAGDAGIFGCRSPPWRRRRGAPTMSLSLQFTEFLQVKTLHLSLTMRATAAFSSLPPWGVALESRYFCLPLCCLASLSHRRVRGRRGGGFEFVLACRRGVPGLLCGGDPMRRGCGSSQYGWQLRATWVARLSARLTRPREGRSSVCRGSGLGFGVAAVVCG